MDTLFDGFLLSVPLVVPLFAFVLYPQVTMVYHFVVEIIFGKFVGDLPDKSIWRLRAGWVS